MARRNRLVLISFAAHAALGAGVYAAGSWQIDRADRVHAQIAIAALHLEPAPSGDALDRPKQELDRKPAKDTQPPKQRTEETPPTVAIGEAGPGTNPEGTPTARGACTDPAACTPPTTPDLPPPPPAPAPPPPPPARPKFVAPTALSLLRISGDTQIHPSSATQNRMVHDGVSRLTRVLDLCVAADGSLTSVHMRDSTPYAEYDEALLAAARRWRYRPYTVDGKAIAVCSTVTFQFELR